MTELTAVDKRELYFLEGIHYLPHLLELADRNRLSRTYGCFDRAFWHYRTSDFPSGMYQECVLPLALAYVIDHPQNSFFHQERLKELVWAGIDFARRSSHRDGSCDDYFPYERAAGAAAFSLYACTEAYFLLKLESPRFLRFFKKRGKYLAGSGYQEAGTLSNHKALIVLALYNVFLVTGDESFKRMAERRLNDLLTLQSKEGWFPEYEGCDPGYLTFTIDFLAKYYQKSEDTKALEPLGRAIEFSSFFLHPDGSYGGEYGSRNTFHFLPHGFELMAPSVPPALGMANAFLESLQKRTYARLEDDRLFGHAIYNFLQAYLDFAPRPAGGEEFKREEGNRFFEEAGLYIQNSGKDYAVISVAKGGVAKIFKKGNLSLSDCGLVGITTRRQKFISQGMEEFRHEILKDKLVIEGYCQLHEDRVFSPFLFLLFRAFLFSVGRFLPANWIRQWIQKQAILSKGKKKKFPLRFRKEVTLPSLDVVTYHLFLEDVSVKIEELWMASDATFIYVAASQPYQSGCLKPWVDLSSTLRTLNGVGHAIFRYRVS